MHPVNDFCNRCDKAIIGTVYSRGDFDLCFDCYKATATRADFGGKNESSASAQTYKDLSPVDMVNRPPHYNQAGIECIDAMQAMTEGAKVNPHAAYCWQNSFKYLWRWPYKNGLQDLQKARWYLDRLISEIEGAENANR